MGSSPSRSCPNLPGVAQERIEHPADVRSEGLAEIGHGHGMVGDLHQTILAATGQGSQLRGKEPPEIHAVPLLDGLEVDVKVASQAVNHVPAEPVLAREPVTPLHGEPAAVHGPLVFVQVIDVLDVAGPWVILPEAASPRPIMSTHRPGL